MKLIKFLNKNFTLESENINEIVYELDKIK